MERLQELHSCLVRPERRDQVAELTIHDGGNVLARPIPRFPKALLIAVKGDDEACAASRVAVDLSLDLRRERLVFRRSEPDEARGVLDGDAGEIGALPIIEVVKQLGESGRRVGQQGVVCEGHQHARSARTEALEAEHVASETFRMIVPRSHAAVGCGDALVR